MDTKLGTDAALIGTINHGIGPRIKKKTHCLMEKRAQKTTTTAWRKRDGDFRI